ncbi:IclR family transcriptional regulator [uncultured Tateyamaria sp.]|uniref:IclR family transcriptional regulator n=1 Tax=Tateyamaria sp. 1078 TaxID=3417464 RepID=UPI00260879AE|nr:IclR family transcriptional regulator [uncultured Tateyamaria sp.]
MPDDLQSDADGKIPTNLRLLVLMEEVARAGVPVLPSELGKLLGLPKPTVHRLLQTAEAEGYLQRSLDGRSYGPGWRMRKLATNTLSSQRVRTERLRVMRDLADALGETCNLAAPGRDGMVYLDRVETHWPLRIQLPIGTQVPFHCTASGKMYLSALPAKTQDRLLSSVPLEQRTANSETDIGRLKQMLSETARRGYATDDEEFMDGMAALAIPVCDDQGRLLTTLSIHAPKIRHDIASLEAGLPKLREAGQRLEELLVG